jgi:hypothetical protein
MIGYAVLFLKAKNTHGNDLTKNDLTKNDLTKNDLTKNDLTKNDLTKNDLTKNDSEQKSNDELEIDLKCISNFTTKKYDLLKISKNVCQFWIDPQIIIKIFDDELKNPFSFSQMKTNGEIIFENNKYVAEKLIITNALTKEELKKCEIQKGNLPISNIPTIVIYTGDGSYNGYNPATGNSYVNKLEIYQFQFTDSFGEKFEKRKYVYKNNIPGELLYCLDCGDSNSKNCRVGFSEESEISFRPYSMFNSKHTVKHSDKKITIFHPNTNVYGENSKTVFELIDNGYMSETWYKNDQVDRWGGLFPAYTLYSKFGKIIKKQYFINGVEVAEFGKPLNNKN